MTRADQVPVDDRVPGDWLAHQVTHYRVTHYRDTDYRDARERIFSFVPPGLMAGATTFGMGQALIGGRLFPAGSCYVQVGERLSEEGGADIPLTWARPRVP